MMIDFQSYTGGEELLLTQFLSLDGFMEMSALPNDSVIASIFDYVAKTDNYACQHASIMRSDKDGVVGYLGTVAFPLVYAGQRKIAVQTSSAFIDKKYPGNFSALLDHFVKANKEHIIFSIFPVPKIYKSLEKKGFIEICHRRFAKHHYIIVDRKGFTNELLHDKPYIRKCVCLLLLFTPKIEPSFSGSYKTRVVSQFSGDYSLIEQSYKVRNANRCAAEWSNTVLDFKYGNKLNTQLQKLGENEAIHIIATNEKNDIIGSIVLKKIRNLKRLIIADIQTINDDMTGIVRSLVGAACMQIKYLKYNTLMFLGLEECYTRIIRKQFLTFSKTIDKKVYVTNTGHIPVVSFSIVYSDDDINF